MFGIEGNEREVVSRVNTYSRTADGVINYLKAVHEITGEEVTLALDTSGVPLFKRGYRAEHGAEAKPRMAMIATSPFRLL